MPAELPYHDARLAFLPEYVEPILDGRKTSTVRGTDPVEAGQRVLATVKGKPFAVLKVSRVVRTTLDGLDATHAKWHGDPDVETLRATVLRFYPKARTGADLYVVRFHVLTVLRHA